MIQKTSLSNPSRIENLDDEIVLARQILPNMYAFILAVLSDKSKLEFIGFKVAKYCYHCGQKIDWSEHEKPIVTLD